MNFYFPEKPVVILLLAVICSFIFTTADADTSFADWKKQQQSSLQKSKDLFADYKSEITSAFALYKRKTSSIWGKDNIAPDKNNWVSYIDQLNQRSVVDFEKGTVDVEIALPVEPGNDKPVGQKKLEDLLYEVMNLGDDIRSIEELAEQPVSQPEGSAILRGQISSPDGRVAGPDEYRKIAQDAASDVHTKTLRGHDGKIRVVYTAQLRLVPDHIRIRADKYQTLVNKYSEQHKVPVSVLFAVIETESMFNPTARSSAPAFGLMQLVPTSGARDAYRYLYKKDKVVTDTYLYNPENNIRLGSAYLYQLNNQYLSGIESERSRMIATIAAYNTGVKNVFRAFVGKYSAARFGSYSKYKQAAVSEINRRKPEQVYQFLRGHLPYHETRDYIKKVTERMARYSIS
ncbi:MAG: murein transglycosylase domain-containing protein [Gammaproteobacteria bacterium]|nr:murein transglycosylase domain-containing protein [Gammaproteobacteria bacterium]